MTKPQRRATEAQTTRYIRLALDAYHTRFVVPLHERIAALEAPWWRRLVRRVWR